MLELSVSEVLVYVRFEHLVDTGLKLFLSFFLQDLHIVYDFVRYEGSEAFFEGKHASASSFSLVLSIFIILRRCVFDGALNLTSGHRIKASFGQCFYQILCRTALLLLMYIEEFLALRVHFLHR